MAKTENIRRKIIQGDPAAGKIIEELLKIPSSGSTVITTEDMTDEEEEIELIAGFMKEGYSQQDAEKEAKRWLQMMSTL